MIRSDSDIIGTSVFLPHNDHIWFRGEIQRRISSTLVEVLVHPEDNYMFNKRETDPYLIQFDLKSTTDDLQTLPPQNLDAPQYGADDMSTLGFLHEANILHNIRCRHIYQLPYTYTGDICIAVRL
jgi:myosin-5